MHGAALALRTALALAYPFLAHAANARDDGALAALALGDLAVILLLGPLLRMNAWAWAFLAVLAPGLVLLARAPWATLPLLAPPVVFVGLVAWLFARTLRPGRVPLITRMASAVHECPVAELEPALATYTRRLTGFWAALLGALCLVNLALAVFATPEGLLAQLGRATPLPVMDARGSLFANLLVHGVVAACFLGEYAWRRHRFPDQPYRNLPGFLRKLMALGPGFWRSLVH
ncbi:MAG TPA: ketosynthase [Xanthomonadaceae bacterium]|nr:ketosynthase [Xanthomonadaceae bacterium]